jgi:hypothetical protein
LSAAEATLDWIEVTPEAALQLQLERYRGMTREERVGIALRLHELACEMSRLGIRRQHPEATPAEVEELLRRRLELARTL